MRYNKNKNDDDSNRGRSVSQQEEKIALIQPGDFIEYRGLYSLERLGPVSIATGPAGKRLILVPGKITRQVSIEPRRIRAILREGKVIACFEEA
jgi:hypothetical protein